MKQVWNSKLLTIVGPTGVGKTALAIELANQYDGELISADSRQIYIGMDIATGKEANQGNWEQRHGLKTLVINDVPIYGLDLVNPDGDFSVYDWQESVLPVISEIRSRGKLPIVVGGTGFYLQALQGKVETLTIKPNAQLRQELEQMSTVELLERLRIADESKPSRVDKHNKRRLIRAIEVAEMGTQETEGKVDDSKYYDLDMIGLTMDRDVLYTKVDARIEQMFTDGLIKETEQLLSQYDRGLPSMTGIGYAEVASHLDGKLALEEAKQKMKWRVHSYIRRQYTWFRKQKVHWVDVGQPNWRNLVATAIKNPS